VTSIDTKQSADAWPLAEGKAYTEPSEFQPSNLLREARRQKNLPELPVPEVCLLDPDGDVVRFLRETGTGHRHAGWACYHTQMWTVDIDDLTIGVVGMAVGAPFAVLVAEQLAASGARVVISITSAGQITPQPQLPCFLLIAHALRDEGTSAHYLPPTRWSYLAPRLQATLENVVGATYAAGHDIPLRAGSSWTTDAPYRETAAAIATARAAGIDCVEMEAAALYAYATARHRDVVCLAHITNTLATTGKDFEKGQHNGALDALTVTRTVANAILRSRVFAAKDDDGPAISVANALDPPRVGVDQLQSGRMEYPAV
jgi:uridine phosphorylase